MIEAIRAHADRLPEIIEARDALESKLAALAAVRRTDADLARDPGGARGGWSATSSGWWSWESRRTNQFHGAITAAARSELRPR